MGHVHYRKKKKNFRNDLDFKRVSSCPLPIGAATHATFFLDANQKRFRVGTFFTSIECIKVLPVPVSGQQEKSGETTFF